MDVIDSIRSIRGERNVPPASDGGILIQAPDTNVCGLLETHLAYYLPSFTRISQLSIAEHQEKPAASATAVSGELVIYIPQAGGIDIEAEKSRLQKRLNKVNSDVASTQKTLENSTFVERAPEAVVVQKQDLLARLVAEKGKLESNFNMLA